MKRNFTTLLIATLNQITGAKLKNISGNMLPVAGKLAAKRIPATTRIK